MCRMHSCPSREQHLLQQQFTAAQADLAAGRAAAQSQKQKAPCSTQGSQTTENEAGESSHKYTIMHEADESFCEPAASHVC